MSQAGRFADGTVLPDLETLTGDIGGAVGVDAAFNIDVFGGANITVTGNPAANVLTIDVTGTTDHTVQIGNATGSLTSLAALANGQLIIGSVGADPAIADMTNGANITWTGGAGTLQADLTGTTDHSIQLGNATGSLTSLGVGATGTILEGVTGADPVFSATPTVTTLNATNVVTDNLTIDVTEQGSVRANAGVLDAIQGENILYVGKHGNDANDGLVWENAFLTINAAVTAAAVGDTIQVDPGTYTETITHAANDVIVIARGKPNNCIITQADANVVNAGAFTGIVYEGFTISCTAATTAINTVQVSTGDVIFRECGLAMTTAANIAAVQQPKVGYVTDTGTLTCRTCSIDFYHTGNGGGTALKGAFGLANGGLVDIARCRRITVTNSGTALATGLGIDLATTGIFYLHDNVTTVTDPDATNVVGFAYLGGTGLTHEFYRNTIHVVATNNIGHGFFSGDTATTSRFFYNHIHVTDVAGTSYSYTIGNGATVVSQFDDLIAADGYNLIVGGIYTEANSPVDGVLSASGIVNTPEIGNNGATTHIAITAAGEVTMPLQPAFLVTQIVAQDNLPINATTILTISNEIFDQNADFNVGTYTFTASLGGRYLLHSNLRLSNCDTASGLYLFYLVTSNRTYGSAIYLTGYTADPTQQSLFTSSFCDMDLGDTAHISVGIPNAGAAQADVSIDGGGATYTNFSGALIC